MSTEHFIQLPHIYIFSAAHRNLQNQSYPRAQSKISKYKKIEIISCILSDHNPLKLEINNKNNNKNMRASGD
jgi:hypothetical protein